MNETAKYLCENIQCVKMAFVQSDEITLILSDFDTNDTQNWFNGNIQKMCSVSSSFATAKFNSLNVKNTLAFFDSRVFFISSRNDVINNLIWRQQDYVRNSISIVAQTYFSSNELHGVKTNQMQEMLFTQKNINWNNYDVGEKRGRIIVKREKHL